MIICGKEQCICNICINSPCGTCFWNNSMFNECIDNGGIKQCHYFEKINENT